MRTTVDLDEELLLSAKERARERGQSVSSVLEDALRRLLSETPAPQKPLRLTTYGSGGPLPGIDLRRTSQLLEDLDDELPLDKRR